MKFLLLLGVLLANGDKQTYAIRVPSKADCVAAVPEMVKAVGSPEKWIAKCEEII